MTGLGIPGLGVCDGGRALAFAAIVAAKGPLAWWRLGEPSGASAADSAGTSAGTYAGAPTLGQPGLVSHDTNTCVLFNGATQWVDLGNPAALSISGSMSGMAWINSSAVATSFQQILSKSAGTGADENYELRFSNTTGKIELVAFIGGVFRTITGNTVLSNNTTYMVGWSYDGANLNLYLNGVPDAAPVPATGAVATNAYNAAIGARRLTAPMFFFVGKIDEVALFNRGLTAAEFAEIYNAGK